MYNLYDFTLEELRATLRKYGLPDYTATQLFNWIYKKRLEDFDAMQNISKKARAFLKATFCFEKPLCVKKQVSADGTIKYALQLEDKGIIETVLIPEPKRATLCLSTQLGCKFGCSFCASAKAGFMRNLQTAEIIGQYLWVVDEGKAPSNIVFMGIGEPLDNFDNVLKAIRILTEPKGAGFGKSKICISTAGVIDAIKKLNQLELGIKLSLSLHSADGHIRSRLMPINRKYPLKELIAAIKSSANKYKRYPVTFEYILIKGLNTSKKDVSLLSRLLHGINYKLNLIPLNQACGVYEPPLPEEIAEFTSCLKRKKIMFTIRKPRGQDIAAACGQLRANILKSK